MKKKIPWNKGLTKEIDNRIKTYWKGKHHSEETKRKISLGNKGKKLSEESIKKGLNTKKGYKHSKETKRKISLGNKGKKHSEEFKKKISLRNKGKKHSEETKRKMSLAHKGKKMLKIAIEKRINTMKINCYKPSEETKRKMSLAHKGKKLSEEHKRILSLAHKGKKNSKEHNENIKKANIGKRYSLKLKNKLSILHTNRIINSKNDYHKKYKYNHNYFRSSWESKVAKWLDENNIKWEYESKNCLFKLNNGRYYIVDFYLPELNQYIEVKGYWDKNSENKCKEFINRKGINSLVVIDNNNINDINLDLNFIETTSDFAYSVEEQIENLKELGL
jgi:hypothetical protein